MQEREWVHNQESARLNPVDWARNFAMLKLAETGYNMIDFRDPNNNIEKFYFKSQGAVGIIVANHRSHADGGVVVEAVHRLNMPGNPHREFILPIARSISTGDQTSNIKNFYKAQEQWFKKRHIHMLEVVRDSDEEKYGLFRSPGQIFALLRNARPDGSYFIFPEAHVEGGRVNPETGNRNGMIEVDNNLLQIIIKQAARKRTPIVFLPIGIEGTENIFDNTVGAKEISRSTLLNVPGIALGFGKKLATATVGTPFSSEDMFGFRVSIDDSEAINDFVMLKVAGLVSPRAGGYYR